MTPSGKGSSLSSLTEVQPAGATLAAGIQASPVSGVAMATSRRCGAHGDGSSHRGEREEQYGTNKQQVRAQAGRRLRERLLSTASLNSKFKSTHPTRSPWLRPWPRTPSEPLPIGFSQAVVLAANQVSSVKPENLSQQALLRP